MVAFWIVFSTIAAPLVIQKVLATATLAGGQLIGGAFSSFFQTAATTAGAAAVASTTGVPFVTAGAAGMAAGLEHAFDRRRTRQRRRHHHRRFWPAAALRPRAVRVTTSPATNPSANSSPKAKATTTDSLWKPPISIPAKRPPATARPVASPASAFDPTQLFAQRDRLPWFWFFVAVAVTVLAALDRYHLVGQFKQRERVVIIDPAQTYYISPLLQFQEAKDLTRPAGGTRGDRVP